MLGIIFMPALFSAQNGEICGRVIDLKSKQPLPGVNIIIAGLNKGTVSDNNGDYRITDIENGIYNVSYSYIGYRTRTKTDIFVRRGKSSFVEVELDRQAIEQDEVVVTSGYFENPEIAPASFQSMNYEEVRRAPGVREDVSRMIQNMPGVNFTSDDRNDLVIRGGSPTEVLFYVDDFELPNPNHFGTQGATGGPMSLINTEFVNKLNFYSGGFNSTLGNKLSGALDIKLREGNRKDYGAKIDLNFGGVGGYLEGPFDGGAGSFYLSFHRSFLELLESVMGYGGIPVYNNLQGKADYNFGPGNRLSVLFIGGDDKINIDHETDVNDFQTGTKDTVEYQDISFLSRQYTTGIKLRTIWGKAFFTKLILSRSFNRYDITSWFLDIWGERIEGENELSNKSESERDKTFSNISTEKITTARLTGDFFLGQPLSISFGGYLKLNSFNHDIIYTPSKPDIPDEYGILPVGFRVNEKISNELKYGGFINTSSIMLKVLTLNAGLRGDYFQLTENFTLSPRLNLKISPNENFSIYGAAGRYYQSPEFIWLTTNHENIDILKDAGCDHLVVGINLLLGSSTQLKVEGYYKKYFDYPVSADSGYEMISLANAGAEYGTNLKARKLVSEGEGISKGFDISLRQALVSSIYYQLSYSWSDTKHKALDNIFRRGEFDNRHIFNLIFGVRFSDEYELSMKYRYASGRPYTPYNINASLAAGEGILDLEKLNDREYKFYSRLDLRFDHREFLSFGALVEYISVENIFDTQNVLSQEWVKSGGRVKFNYQTGFFIVGGIALEF